MESSVVPLLSKGQPLTPLTGFLIAHTPEICFQASVDHLSLAICLWVIGSGQKQGRALNGQQSLAKVIEKDFVPVTDDTVRLAMKLKHMIQICLGHIHGCIRVTTGGKMSILTKPINHHKDNLLTKGFWESLNKIHGHILPNLLWGLHRL